MGKLMLAVGVLAGIVLVDPMGAVSTVVPQAAWLGYKITKTVENEKDAAYTAFFRR